MNAPWAILDTNVYVGHWEQGRHAELLAKVRDRFVVRHSAVVLSELRRGARTAAAGRLVDQLHRIARVLWAPLAEDWWEAGVLIQRVGDAHDWETTKRREFQNDALIALTARRYGATVVTDNRDDLHLLAAELRIPVLPA